VGASRPPEQSERIRSAQITPRLAYGIGQCLPRFVAFGVFLQLTKCRADRLRIHSPTCARPFGQRGNGRAEPTPRRMGLQALEHYGFAEGFGPLPAKAPPSFERSNRRDCSSIARGPHRQASSITFSSSGGRWMSAHERPVPSRSRVFFENEVVLAQRRGVVATETRVASPIGSRARVDRPLDRCRKRPCTWQSPTGPCEAERVPDVGCPRIAKGLFERGRASSASPTGPPEAASRGPAGSGGNLGCFVGKPGASSYW
jgi:hypothetical protein